MSRHADQWVFWGLVAIRWRIECWSLNVRIVIRTAGSEIHHANVQLLQQFQELNRFCQILFIGMQRAWRMTGRSDILITGPYAVDAQ